MQVVVPVKSFNHAKNRLATVLTAQQRSELIKHMLDDVLRAVVATPEVEGVTVVSSDSEVVQWVHQYAQAIKIPLRAFDPGSGRTGSINTLAEAGLCHAYSAVAADLLKRGASTMLLLPADIPLVTQEDIQALLAVHTRPGVSVAAAGSDGGTNGLLVSPPDIIAPAFGENSCLRHCTHAREQGLEALIVNTAGLSLDIDTLEDIQTLLATDRECATLCYLRDSGLATELQKNAKAGQLKRAAFQQHDPQHQINRQVG